MPKYAYRCNKCSHEFELRQGFDSPRVMPCPECEALSNRMFFPVLIRFIGSGWYVNDSKARPDRRKYGDGD